MPEEHDDVQGVTYVTAELAARAHGAQQRVAARGGYIFAADGVRLARGWTAYAAALLPDGVILPDGDGYRLASADATTTPDASASATLGAVELEASASAAAAVPAPPLVPAAHSAERDLPPDSPFRSPEQAARHHATTIGVTSPGGWITAADGGVLARGWTAYARILLQDGVILADSAGYRLAGPQHPSLLSRLVPLAQQGDRGALQALVERYRGTVSALALHVLRDFEQARDVAQDVLLKVCQSLETLKDPRFFRSWLGHITVNLCRDRLRRAKLRGHESVEALGWRVDVMAGWRPVSWSLSDPAAIVSRKEIGQHLTAALAKLTEKHRTPLLLHELEGLPYDEIAQRLGCPPGTVMSRLFAARQRMQQALRDRGVEGAHYAA